MNSKAVFTKKDVVVIVLCGVFLMATLGSVGVSGRRRAKEAVCLSNLRQWGPVFLAFAADNDGYFTQGWIPEYTEPDAYKHYWMEALRAYYGNNHNLRCCPEAVVPGTDTFVEGWPGGPYGGLGTFVGWGAFPGECGQPSNAWNYVVACDYGSYGMNGFLCNPPPQTDNIFGRPTTWNWRTANVAGADNIPLLTGAQWLDAWPHHTDYPPEYDGHPWNYDHYISMLRICMNRHSGCVNSAFLDASARKVPLKCLWKLDWSRAFDPDEGPSEEEFPEWMAEFPPCE